LRLRDARERWQRSSARGQMQKFPTIGTFHRWALPLLPSLDHLPCLSPAGSIWMFPPTFQPTSRRASLRLELTSFGQIRPKKCTGISAEVI
jgi:hypothetical protein